MRVLMVAAASVGLLVLGSPALAQDGATIYTQSCQACHQPVGAGIAGAFPKLAGNVFVNGPAQPVVHTVLNGRGGMPQFGGDLTDEQIATVISYVRSSFGNTSGPVTANMVKAEREAGNIPPPADGQQAH